MRVPMRMAAMLLILLATATQGACSRPGQQHDYASAEEAIQALLTAVQSNDTRALLQVLGSEAEPAIDSGDPVQDRNARQRFLRAYAAGHALDTSEKGVTTLQVGTDQWPFPFPVVRSNGRWRFDSRTGTEEIVNRRVGANELSTIQSCLAFVDAQREYYARNPQQQSLLQFAQKLVSTPDRKDGLYWPTAADEAPSPLGERFARARSEGYFEKQPRKDKPFRGYIYRLLTAQGPHAAGGAYDYMVGDKMMGGFALLAVPAEYGNSGVMSFIVNHDGVVYSKDLGPDTPRAANVIAAFDPDETWKREAAIEPAR